MRGALVQKFLEELDPPTHEEERYKRIIEKYLDEEFDRGKEYGRDLEAEYWNP